MQPTADRPTISIDVVLNAVRLGSYRRVLFGACALIMAIDGFDAYLLSNLAPFIARNLAVPIAAMGAVFTAQAAGLAIGYYTVSLLADRFGRRRIIVACAAIFGLLTLATTQVTTLDALVLVRFLAFASFGGMLPNVVALLAEFLPDARRRQLLTWVFIAHGLGASVGGMLGPTFVAYHSWRAAFWTGGVVLLITTVLLYLRLPESCRYWLLRDPSDARIGETLARVDPTFRAPPGSIFVTDEPAGRGLPLVQLFRDGRASLTLLLWVASGAALCVTATLTAWLPSLLHAVGTLDPAVASRASSVSALGATIAPLMVTFLMRFISQARALSVMFIAGALALMLFARVAQFPGTAWVLSFCFGLLVIGGQAGLNSLIGSSYPTSMRATGIGWAGGVGRLTATMGPGTAAAMLADHWSASAIYAALASPLFLAALVLYWAERRQAAPASSAVSPQHPAESTGNV
jgi:AAHS family 4-hydroxybenzoate transporter-like MFS transporter